MRRGQLRLTRAGILYNGADVGGEASVEKDRARSRGVMVACGLMHA